MWLEAHFLSVPQFLHLCMVLYNFLLVLFLYLFLTVLGSSLLHEGFLQSQEAELLSLQCMGFLTVAFLIVSTGSRLMLQ